MPPPRSVRPVEAAGGPGGGGVHRYGEASRPNPIAAGLALLLTAVLIAVPAAAVLLWSNLQGTLAALMPFLLTFLSGLAITLWAVHGGLEDPVRLAVIPVVLAQWLRRSILARGRGKPEEG